MNFIGMDIHKDFTVAVAKDGEGNLLEENNLNNVKWIFQEFLSKYPPEKTKIVMESTCVWEYIFDMIEDLGYEAVLSNPNKTKAIASARIKTDKVDAGTLSDLLRSNMIAESYIPSKDIRRLRELTRERGSFVKQTTQIKNKIRGYLIKRGVKMPNATICKKTLLQLRQELGDDEVIFHYFDILEYNNKKLRELDETIRNIANENSQTRLLMTIPGIAGIRALEIMAEIGDIGRFESANKLCSYAGLVPSIKQSGNNLKHGRLIKDSSKILKATLIETSWSLAKTKETNPLQEHYKKLKRKKGKQKAICATARKLCCVIYSMLKKQEEFIYS